MRYHKGSIVYSPVDSYLVISEVSYQDDYDLEGFSFCELVTLRTIFTETYNQLVDTYSLITNIFI